MTASGRLSEQQVLALGRGLLTELERLHASGRVSGVVGPATVLVDEAGGVQLADGPRDQAYAAPELLDGRPPTPRSDLYSAAALMAHLLRGEPTLPPTAADLDPGLGWLLGPVLVADPDARPPSAAGMVAALDQLAEQRQGSQWRVAAGLVGATGAAGAVPVLVLATGGTASAAGVAAAAGAAGGAGGATASGAAGSAASLAGTGATGQVAAAGGASASGAAGTGQGLVGGSGAPAAGHGSHAVAGGLSKGVAVKISAAVAAGGIGVAGAAAAVILLTGSETKHVDLPAKADIYLAGADDEVAAQLSDPGDEPVPVDVDGAGTVSFPSVEGELGACDGCELESPDGGSLSFGSTGITGFNGIAGVTFADRTLFVVGVFVGDEQPSHPDDAVVDLTAADDQVTQEPELGEPFFVGDGETADGEQQEVVVPDGAKTLYLGFADAYGFQGTPGAYGDNVGSVDIEVTID